MRVREMSEEMEKGLVQFLYMTLFANIWYDMHVHRYVLLVIMYDRDSNLNDGVIQIQSCLSRSRALEFPRHFSTIQWIHISHFIQVHLYTLLSQ